MSKTTALHVHHYSTKFLWRPLHDYDTKPPNATFYGGRGHTTTNFPFSIWTWIKALKNSTPGKVAYIWRWAVRNRRDKVWKDANSFFLLMFSLPLSLSLSLSSLLKVHIMPRQNRNSLPLVKLFCELFFLLPRYLKITSISSILFVAKLIQERSWNRERKKTRSLCLCHHWCFGSGPFTLKGVCVSRYERKCRIVLDLRRGFRIPISLFQALSGELLILESPQSLVGFRIPQVKIFRIAESGYPYMGWRAFAFELASLNECIVSSIL